MYRDWKHSPSTKHPIVSWELTHCMKSMQTMLTMDSFMMLLSCY